MNIMPMKNLPMKAMGMKDMDDSAQVTLVANGQSLFVVACSSCHGASGQGGFGPALYGLGLPDAKIAAVIKNGVKPRMPAFGGKYSQTQMQALVAYVQSLKAPNKLSNTNKPSNTK